MDSTDSTEEKDAGPEVQINFPESVLSRIEELMGDTEQFDCAEFDAVGYINRMFPSEQSLAGVEAAAARCEWRLAGAGRRLAAALQRAPARDQGRAALTHATDTIQHLALQVADINARASRSESMVREITLEIKQLDCAKSNLTAAITALNHYHMLLGGVDTLRAMTQQRQYKEIVLPLQAIMEVLQHFEQYRDIGELSALRDKVTSVRETLAEQLVNDLRTYFTAGSKSPLSSAQAAAACGALDLLDVQARDKLLEWLVDYQLQEYQVLFASDQESSWLPSLDARFAWLKRHLLALERAAAAPAAWRLSERVAARYCILTRDQLTSLLSARQNELDVKLLLQAVQRTNAFELLLDKRFNGPSTEDSTDNSANTAEEKQDNDANEKQPLPPATVVGELPVRWRGAISACYEPHLGIYVASLDQTLRALVDRLLQEASSGEADSQSWGAEAGAVLSSCAELFVLYKKCLVQCAQLSTGLPMLQLCGVFRQHLRQYTRGVLRAALPRGSTAGPLPALVTSLLRDDAASRLTPQEVSRVASVITTAEYCLETTVHLEQKLKEKIDSQLADKVDLAPEQEQLHAVIEECVQLLSRDLQAACAPALAAMTKLPWAQVQAVGDGSAYVSQLSSTLRQAVPSLRDQLSASRKYFTQLCIRFASSFIPNFIATIYKCKPLSTVGSEQLLLDAHLLKTALLELPSFGLATRRPAPATYTRVVLKLMSKAEMILKLVMAPLDSPAAFAAQFATLLPDGSLAELHRVLDMKGARLGKAQAQLDAAFRDACRNRDAAGAN